jgi:uncharacterized protein involved in outer membrane biogenesis
MNKYLRYSLISTGLFIGILLLAAIIIPLAFENQIKRLFIAEMNKQLATEVILDEKDINLTILKNFPNASVLFKNVAMKESVEMSDKNFLEADKISLVFNIKDILQNNYVIKSIIVEDGFCKLITDKKGNINYKFWKESENQSSEDFSVELREVVLLNIDFIYTDQRSEDDVAIFINAANLSGNFSSQVYKLTTDADILSKHINTGGSQYLINKAAKIKTELQINIPEKKYTFNTSEIEIEGNYFLVGGYFSIKEKNYYDLEIDGDKIRIEGLLLLLPGNISSRTGQLENRGRVSFNASIKGYSSDNEKPHVKINYSVNDASVSHKKFGDKLTHVNFNGGYSNGGNNRESSLITIKNFTARQNDNPLSLSQALSSLQIFFHDDNSQLFSLRGLTPGPTPFS